MRHPLLVEWEKSLKAIFDEIDDYLEEKYGDRYSLRPTRPRRGETSSKSQDGLFNIGVKFSPGYGSKYGRGYVIDVEMATFDLVPEDVQRQIELDVVRLVRKELPTRFPGRDLNVSRDGNVFKIYGDLSLGSL